MRHKRKTKPNKNKTMECKCMPKNVECAQERTRIKKLKIHKN